jgi:hypothetical protein
MGRDVKKNEKFGGGTRKPRYPKGEIPKKETRGIETS